MEVLETFDLNIQFDNQIICHEMRISALMNTKDGNLNDVYDWDTHWSVYDENTRNNPAQKFRFRLINKILKQIQGSVLVDIGCGQGDLLQYLSDAYPEKTFCGFELSPSGVKATQIKVPSADVKMLDLFHKDAVKMLSAVKADIATCSEVLEHVPDPREFLVRAKATIVHGGYFVATVPGGPRTPFDIEIGHLQHFSKRSICKLFEDAGFESIEVSRAGFPFFNLYKVIVMARGKKVKNDYEGKTTVAFRVALWIFGVLFRLNKRDSAIGWQLVVKARKPLSVSAVVGSAE